MLYNPNKIFIVLLLISSTIIFANCFSPDQTNDPQSVKVKIDDSKNVSAKNDPVELGKAINLNKEPNELAYKEFTPPQENSDNSITTSTDKKFLAVLKFSPEETERIIERAKKYREPVSVKIDVEKWFPAGLVAQSQSSGDESLKGKTYAATDFLKTPYTDGKLIRIENSDYLILELVAF